jgi:hypothetical protein
MQLNLEGYAARGLKLVLGWTALALFTLTRSSETALKNDVLLMPRLSARSCNPFAISGKPIFCACCESCLRCEALMVPGPAAPPMPEAPAPGGPDSDGILFRSMCRPCRRGGGGGGSGTSIGMCNMFRFSIMIEAPVAGVGVSWRPSACRSSREEGCIDPSSAPWGSDGLSDKPDVDAWRPSPRIAG